MRANQIKNLPILKDKRRSLRKNLTPAEAFLWSVLQNRKLKNRKFRRQQSIEFFIVDFYCPAERLIIELDGEYHNEPMQAQKDYERDCRLKELGYTVIRFENKEVFEQLDNVLAEIESCFLHGD